MEIGDIVFCLNCINEITIDAFDLQDGFANCPGCGMENDLPEESETSINDEHGDEPGRDDAWHLAWERDNFGDS